VPVAPYNPRNTNDPKDTAYSVEDHIDEHSEDIQLRQFIIDETYNHRTGVEPTTQSRTAASDTSAPEAASTHEQKCSLCSVSGSSLPSPTSNEESIRDLRSYEMDSMTRSK
jgi:hypothetical protein